MKKLSLLALLAAVAVVGCQPAPAIADGVPTDITVALPGGASNVGTVLYTAGLTAASRSALRPLAVSWTCAGLNATNVITLGKAAGGAAWETVGIAAAASANGVKLLTSEWYWLRGDTIAIKASVTNAMTVTLHGLER